MPRGTCVVVGGGPAGLMAAERLAADGVAVTVFDRMPSVGRKFLMAGIGGLNLTHSEPLERFLSRYRAEGGWLRDAVEAFPPDALRDWCEALGQPTFVGSSGRVFPRSFKASPLLRAWLQRLSECGVEIRTRCRWLGWEGDALVFDCGDGIETVTADATILALGGASWPKLGSDGRWVDILRDATPHIAPLRPSNCGFMADWSQTFRDRFAGHPVKSCAFTAQDVTLRGEAMITAQGIEGGAVYALSPILRDDIDAKGEATLFIDFKPAWTADTLASRLDGVRSRDSLANRLRKAARLPPVAVALCRQAGEVPNDARALAVLLKKVPVRLSGTAPIERAISTAGGIEADAVDARMMLKGRPGVFVAGEMLDWEAPTGGYLLQASFASGRATARGALGWLAERS